MPNVYASWSKVLSFFQLRKKAYCAIPRPVLADLAEFCRADRSCWHPDPRVHAVLEGRREVWLRIQRYINLPAEQLVPLVKEAQIPMEDTNG
jgi:hypothetical protein